MAPPPPPPDHFAQMVRDFLNERFSNRWIGRGSWKAWPPRSSDMTPLHFYLLSHVTQNVYNEPIRNIQRLKHRIYEAIASVDSETPKMFGESPNTVCRYTERPMNGASIEL